MQGAQLGVWTFDPDKDRCGAPSNPSHARADPDNLLADARELEKYIHPDDWEALAAPYYGTYPDVPLGMEFRVPLGDGHNRWIYALAPRSATRTASSRRSTASTSTSPRASRPTRSWC